MAALLRTEGLSKRFRGLVANEAIDFALERGQVRCIIGPNGAGKTTFVSMISGHLAPSAGRIWFADTEISRWPIARRARAGIGRKFQTPAVFDALSVEANLDLATLGSRRPQKARRARIHEVAGLVRLADRLPQPAVQLSHGQRQWLEIGMLIANDAELLLLDEPTAGMTAEETHATGELVRSLASRLNLSTIIIEHDINFIRDLAAPVTVLHLGRVLAEGAFTEIAADARVRDVYLGHA